jgi:hypothetical protein
MCSGSLAAARRAALIGSAPPPPPPQQRTLPRPVTRRRRRRMRAGARARAPAIRAQAPRPPRVGPAAGVASGCSLRKRSSRAVPGVPAPAASAARHRDRLVLGRPGLREGALRGSSGRLDQDLEPSMRADRRVRCPTVTGRSAGERDAGGPAGTESAPGFAESPSHPSRESLYIFPSRSINCKCRLCVVVLNYFRRRGFDFRRGPVFFTLQDYFCYLKNG